MDLMNQSEFDSLTGYFKVCIISGPRAGPRASGRRTVMIAKEAKNLQVSVVLVVVEAGAKLSAATR